MPKASFHDDSFPVKEGGDGKFAGAEEAMAFLKSMREGGGEDGEDGEWEGVRAEHLATVAHHEIDTYGEDDFEEIQVAEERKEEYE